MKKYLLLFFFAAFVCVASHGQELLDTTESRPQGVSIAAEMSVDLDFDLTDPRPQGVSIGSPEALTMVRDINIPANYNTGTLDVQVPLYEFNYAGFRFPVTLSYNTSGIKVDDEPTIVGLEWRLNAGGAIVRVVRGPNPDGYGCVENTKGSDPNMQWSRADFDIKIKDGYDTEPDMYYFSTPTCSGMFILNGAHGLVIPYQNISVDYENDPDGGKFYITDSEGTIYTFGLGDNTHDLSTQATLKWNKSMQEYETVEYDYISTWHLNKISKGCINIHLYYQPSDTTLTMHNKNHIKTYHGSCKEAGEVVSTTSKVTTHPNYLSSIVWSGGQVSLDVSNHRLNAVKISDKHEDYETDIALNYGKFFNGHLRLESIEELAPEGQKNNRIAEFFYNEQSITLEDARDHFDYMGYYNGSRSGQEYGIKHSQGTWDVVSYVLSSREPDLDYAKAFSLRKIVYPFGGYKEFEYELNSARVVNNRDAFLSSGLRIKKVTECAYHNAEPAVTNYQYGCREIDGYLDGTGTRTNNIPMYLTSISRTADKRFYYAVSNKCLTTLADLDGTIVQYPIVWEILPDGSKNEYKYTSHADYPDLPAQKRDATDNTDSWKNVSQGPVTQTSRHYARGLLTGKSSYDKDGDLVYSEEHVYRLGKINRRREVIVPCRELVEGNSIDPNNIPYEQYVFCKYEWLSQPVLKLGTYVNATKYCPASDTEYTYDSTFNQPVRIVKTDAAGNVFETCIKYAFDYSVSGNQTDPVLKALASMRQWRLWKPIEVVTFRNGIAVEGKVFVYKYSGFSLYEVKYLPQTGVSKDDYVFSSVSSAGFSCDARYKTDICCYEYDENNRPIAFRKRDGTVNSIVYDHAGNMIAYVENARRSKNPSVNTVFYTGFESFNDLDLEYRTYFGEQQAKGGMYVGQGSMTIPVATLDGNDYLVSYWSTYDIGKSWSKKEYTVPGNAGSIEITVANNECIDEVRIAPKGARFRSTSYRTDNGNVISEADFNGISTHYRYDIFGRPAAMLDNALRFIEKYDLNY